MVVIPVILSGGSGTRLWPLSVSSSPKQFLPLISDKTMIQETLLRLSSLETESPIVICNEAHRFIVAEQISEVSEKKPAIMLEPIARNTAPAIAVGAHQAMKIDKDAVMVVLPSDHVIKNVGVFCEAVKRAAKEAMNGSFVTFGIVPTCPHTGYGYIQTDLNSASGNEDRKVGEAGFGVAEKECGMKKRPPKNGISENGSDACGFGGGDGNAENFAVFDLKRFVEKPDLETAKKYLSEGNYSWNSGMFVFKAKSFLDELEAFEPEMASLAKKAFENAVVDEDFIRINKTYFEKIKGNSIDYCVMERTKKGKVIKLDAGWDDVGSWSALWEISAKDENNNVIKGKAVTIDTRNSYINAKKTVSTIGVSNLVIVESDEAILVANKDNAQDVKRVVERLGG